MLIVTDCSLDVVIASQVLREGAEGRRALPAGGGVHALL